MSLLTIDEGHAWTIWTSFTNTLQIAIKKLATSNLEALLDHLGSVLVHAVLSREAENVVNSATTIRGSAMFADVLNAPIAKLTMGDDINAGEHLVDARTLRAVSKGNLIHSVGD